MRWFVQKVDAFEDMLGLEDDFIKNIRIGLGIGAVLGTAILFLWH